MDAPGGRSDRRRALRWGLAALFLSTTLLSLGPFLNDEVLQAIAYQNLFHGDLSIETTPEETDHLWRITDGVRFPPREPDVVGDRVVPNASGLLNVLALPVGWLLLLVDRLVPVRVVLLAGWGVLGHHVTRWGVDAARDLWGRGPVDWRRGPVPGWMWLGWAWTGLAAWGAASMPAIDLRHWLPVVAPQLTDVLLSSLTAALLWLLVARAVPGGRRLAGLAVVLVLLSPALFWGMSAKYHAAQALLPVAAALLYHEGVRLRREGLVLAAVAVAGLAVWSNEMGVAVVGAVGLVHAGSLLRGGPWSWRDGRHILAFGASAVAGLVPWLVYATATYTAPWSRATPVAGGGGGPGAGGPGGPGGPGAGGGGGVGEGVGQAADSVTAQWQFQDLGDLARNVWDAHLDASRFEGEPTAVLLIAPWVVVALLAMLRPGKPAGVRLLALHVVLTWLVVGPRLPTQGSGLDPRFLAGLWPGYAALAAWGLHGLDWDRAARRRATLTAVAGSLLAVLALWVLTASGVVLDLPDDLQVTRAQRWVGRAVLLLVLLAAALHAHRPSRPWLPAAVGLALVPAALWVLDAVVVHHRRLPGVGGGADAAFLTPVGHWLWDWAWDALVACRDRYICRVR